MEIVLQVRELQTFWKNDEGGVVVNLLKMYHALPITLQNLALSIYGYKMKKERYGSTFRDEYNRLRKIKFASIEEAKDYQFNSLKKNC
jgi:hypothetical protein